MSDYPRDGFRSCPASPFGELPLEDAPAAKRAAARAEAEASRTADTVAVTVPRAATSRTGDTNPLGTRRSSESSSRSSHGVEMTGEAETVGSVTGGERTSRDGGAITLPDQGTQAESGRTADSGSGTAAQARSNSDATPSAHAAADAQGADTAPETEPPAKRGRVRGRRLPELLDDGDGYTLPSLARHFDGDGALREAPAPDDPGLRFYGSSLARSEDELPQAPHTPRALLLGVVAVFMIGFGVVSPAVGYMQLLWASPIFLAASVCGILGFITGDQPRILSGSITLVCLLCAVTSAFAPTWILSFA